MSHMSEEPTGIRACELCDKLTPIDDLDLCYGDVLTCRRCQREDGLIGSCDHMDDMLGDSAMYDEAETFYPEPEDTQ